MSRLPAANFRAQRDGVSKIETGIIGEHHWGQVSGEETGLSVGGVVRGLSEYLTGLRAVNVSWDSGKLGLSKDELAAGWRLDCGYAITPVIDLMLLNSWPESSYGAFDEWYFFRDVPQIEIRLEAFCNWCMESVGQWPDLVACLPDSIDLGRQLQAYRPEVVIGCNASVFFVIAKDPKVIRVFAALSMGSDSEV